MKPAAMPTLPRRALLLFSKYGESQGDRYLTNELADAMVEEGFEVDVIVVPWDAPPNRSASLRTEVNGITVLSSPPIALQGMGRLLELASKWALSSVIAWWRARSFLKAKRYDLVFAVSPLSVLSALILGALRGRNARSYAYLVDFFPHHHQALGLFPGGPFISVAAWIEGVLIRMFDTVACMSESGEKYLRRHYRLGRTQRIESLALWTDDSTKVVVDRGAVRREFGLPVNRKIAVFGGQIALGRGIEEILQAADLAARDVDIVFLFVGSGPLEHLVRRAQASNENIVLVPALDRDRYLKLAAACDVGIVCTVSNVDAPTFPSKTLDYLRAGLPVAASVEAATDYGRFIEEAGFGLSTQAGSASKLLNIIMQISDDQNLASSMSLKGQAALSTIFSVRRAVGQITSACGLHGHFKQAEQA
jgi:glycosyltransferase involved in cell wall biosynthesis